MKRPFEAVDDHGKTATEVHGVGLGEELDRWAHGRQEPVALAVGEKRVGIADVESDV